MGSYAFNKISPSVKIFDFATSLVRGRQRRIKLCALFFYGRGNDSVNMLADAGKVFVNVRV